MASNEVTGRTQAQVVEMRREFNERHEDDDMEFDQCYCLSEIPRQPEDYNGPVRYCINTETYEVGSSHRCPFHGGKTDPDKLEDPEIAPMKHGMTATREALLKDFSKKDAALYDWVTRKYPEVYDIDTENNPSAEYDLHRLAVEIVRAERGRGYLTSEGEVHEKKVRDEEGKIVVDENGEVVTEKSEHYLANMIHRQDKKINSLEKELGITRREQQKNESTTDAVEAMKGFAEVGKAFIEDDENDYDPDAKPWQDNDSDSNDGDS